MVTCLQPFGGEEARVRNAMETGTRVLMVPASPAAARGPRARIQVYVNFTALCVQYLQMARALPVRARPAPRR